MILDPNGIASATGELSVADDDSADVEKRSAEVGELTSMLVFRAVDEAPKAVPLNLIARLEEIDLAKIEHSNGQHMVQYRGQLVPLVSMEDKKEFGGEGRQPVLIFTDGERTMGLVVDEIVDIVEDHLKIELTSDQDDCMGTAVIDGKATDIIDASYYLTQAYPDWFEGSGQEQRNAQETRLLLIDDSPFFRNLLQPLLSISGYEVVCVESAAKALELEAFTASCQFPDKAPLGGAIGKKYGIRSGSPSPGRSGQILLNQAWYRDGIGSFVRAVGWERQGSYL